MFKAKIRCLCVDSWRYGANERGRRALFQTPFHDAAQKESTVCVRRRSRPSHWSPSIDGTKSKTRRLESFSASPFRRPFFIIFFCFFFHRIFPRHFVRVFQKKNNTFSNWSKRYTALLFLGDVLAVGFQGEPGTPSGQLTWLFFYIFFDHRLFQPDTVRSGHYLAVNPAGVLQTSGLDFFLKSEKKTSGES